MTTRPLLYLSARPQRAAADGEHAAFQSALGRDLDRHDLVDAPLPADALVRYAGVVVGGSPFNVADPAPGAIQRRVEADLARVALAAARGDGIAAVFTCYGIGVATRALGGRVTLERPEGTGAVTLGLTAAGAADPLFGAMGARFDAFTAHKESVADLPPGAVLLATNAACPVQAYRVGDRLYATQFHPELRPSDFTARMRVYRDAGYFDPSLFDEVAAAIMAASVSAPRRMLRAFADRFAG